MLNIRVHFQGLAIIKLLKKNSIFFAHYLFEIFKQYQFVKEKEFVNENEEAFEILRNISNSVNYFADMCRSCPFTFYVPFTHQGSSLLVHFVRVRVSSSIPASSLCSLRSPKIFDCFGVVQRILCMSSLHIARPFGQLCSEFQCRGRGLHFPAFSQHLIPFGYGEIGFGCGCFLSCLGGFDCRREWYVISWCGEEGWISGSLDFLYT